ncbi:MAG: hypothetical protein ACK4YL_19470 [Microcystis sp.]|nr:MULTISPECIES: hypothetical protein [unclassified Microcystis]MCE2668419.1 hypothetical protein [Microcystis sp. 49638_E5]MCZ8057707.1 hypothetical protein [Microcystis sp. LE19-12.2C]MDJ0552155.1 hypothetical protein [Microcystis sp. M49637_WE12]MDJ0586100.1 hypothetical protein [Microcystis sp. M49636_WE2]
MNPSKELTHITLVEEAHNVLKNVASKGSEEGGTSDVKAKAVQSFCNMLAEVRAYIAHQLRDTHDREAIANAMIMSEEQRDFLGKCETGRAAIFYTGLQKATFIDVPVYKDPAPPTYEGKSSIENCYRGFDENFSRQQSDEEVRVYMSRFGVVKGKMINCFLCTDPCEYRDDILRLAEESKDEFNEAWKSFKKAKNKTESMKNLARLILKVTNIEEEKSLYMAWCYTQEVAYRCRINALNQSHKNSFIKSFKEVICKE